MAIQCYRIPRGRQGRSCQILPISCKPIPNGQLRRQNPRGMAKQKPKRPRNMKKGYGNRLLAVLSDLRVSQADLARRCGFKEGTVSRWAHDRNAPSSANLAGIAAEFGYDRVALARIRRGGRRTAAAVDCRGPETQRRRERAPRRVRAMVRCHRSGRWSGAARSDGPHDGSWIGGVRGHGGPRMMGVQFQLDRGSVLGRIGGDQGR